MQRFDFGDAIGHRPSTLYKISLPPARNMISMYVVKLMRIVKDDGPRLLNMARFVFVQVCAFA